MDQEEAPPPPYSAVDPLLTPANNSSGNAQSTSGPVREHVAELPAAGSSRIVELPPSTTPAVVPINFTSAVAYFEERFPLVSDDTRSTLHHHMTIYPRSQSKDFPRRPRCWSSRREEITQQDWDTFLRYLFPPHLGLAAASQQLHPHVRAEIQRDRKDRPQESDEQRRARIMTVVDEWNQCFFEPRAAGIVSVYIGEADEAPESALCPRCYPAATKATQGTTTASPSVEGQSPWSSNTPSPVPGQHAQSPGWPYVPGPYGIPTVHVSYGPQYGAPPGHMHPQPPPPGAAPWQYPYPYAHAPNPGSGTSKGGPFGWISNITAQAQKYGERFAEQAQHYGDQISAQAMQYGRQVEEHARWVEEQARFSRKYNTYAPGGYAPRPPWLPAQTGTPPAAQTAPVELDSLSVRPTSTQSAPVQTSTYSVPVQPQISAQTRSSVQVQSLPQTQTLPQTQNSSRPQSLVQTESRNLDDGKDQTATESSRRDSIDSIASDGSLSSFHSLSSCSDLDASDLAKVRTQLQSLNYCHDRVLYDAAVDLRNQLDVLKVSRREARSSGRPSWGRGQGRQGSQARDHTDWGRWDSPEAQQRQDREKKAMKEELRATRKAFREVVRRAREEQYESRRARKKRQRKEGKNKSVDKGYDMSKDQVALDQRLSSLSLGQQQTSHPVRAQTDPAGYNYSAHPAPVRADTSSVISSASSIHARSSSQTSTTEPPAEGTDRKSLSGAQRLRDKLKSRSTKKQQQ
ncbi:hypothetical protein N7540_000437 [Penicillium herquei]|nr:hypothetical protein N7540_000437 [Penicillium herquei]